MKRARNHPAMLTPLFLALAACAEPGRLDDPALAAAVDQIRPAGIERHLRALADDEMQGRGTGSHGYLSAANYVAEQFEAIGLAPVEDQDGLFQNVPLASTQAVAELCSMRVAGPAGRARLAEGTDYVMRGDFFREESGLTAGVAYVGYGVSAPGLDYDDYSGVDVRGKLVLLLRGAPPSFPPDRRAYHASSELKLRRAVEQGAAGVLQMLRPEDRERSPWERIARQSAMSTMRWLEDDGTPHGADSALYVEAWLSPTGAEKLFAGADRTLDVCFESARASRPDSFVLPTTLELRNVSHHGRLESPNVLAVLPGSGSEGEYVALTAHLDHLGIGEPVDGDAIYNGAYDNASGVAILLEVARVMAAMPTRPRRSVLFLAVTGEEKGLLGSDYFAHHPAVPLSSIVANINLDMVMMLHPLHDVVAFGAEHSTLGTTVEQVVRHLELELTPDPMPEEAIFVRSDHYSFVRKGIPAVFLVSGFRTGDDRDGGAMMQDWIKATYHSPGDDLDQPFDFEAGARFARANFLTTWLVANDDHRPAWRPGDFFGELFGGAD